jgi:hypothetical protein
MASSSGGVHPGTGTAEQKGSRKRSAASGAVGEQAHKFLEAAMVRTEWCVLAVAAGSLVACGTSGATADPEPNPATAIGPPPAGTTTVAPGADWTMPTGVFRAERQEQGLFELHVDPGQFHLFEVRDGSPDVAYVADCVADDPSTVTCTESSGFQIVFAWTLTGDALELTLPGGLPPDRAVWEGPPWIRVP